MACIMGVGRGAGGQGMTIRKGTDWEGQTHPTLDSKPVFLTLEECMERFQRKCSKRKNVCERLGSEALAGKTLP